MMKTKLSKRIVAAFMALVIIAATCVPAQDVAAEAMDNTAVNTTFSTAKEMNFGMSIAEEPTEGDEKRFYRFNLSQASEIVIRMKKEAEISRLQIQIYDETKTEVYQSKSNNGTSQVFSIGNIYLTGGTYYMQITSVYQPCGYYFTATADSLEETYTETQDKNNNVVPKAEQVSLQQKYKGVLAQNDDMDYYKFLVPSSGKINFNMKNATDGILKYIIYDSYMNLCYSQNVHINGKVSEYIPLTAGNYFLAITKNDVNFGVGSYTFYMDYFVITPNKPVIKSIKNTSAKKMTVTWDKVIGAEGLELQYSTNSSFKTSVVKKKISANETSASYTKLTKGKKYYVRMRAYVSIKNEKKYGKWSAKKSVMIIK